MQKIMLLAIIKCIDTFLGFENICPTKASQKVIIIVIIVFLIIKKIKRSLDTEIQMQICIFKSNYLHQRYVMSAVHDFMDWKDS